MYRLPSARENLPAKGRKHAQSFVNCSLGLAKEAGVLQVHPATKDFELILN
jgi:hypothetical protein